MDFIRNFPMFSVVLSLFSGVLCTLLDAKKAKTYTILYECVVLAMTLSWTPLTAETVQGVQGRYFLPLLPLLAFVIRDNRIRVQESFRRSMVFVTVLINIWMLAYAHGQIIFQRLP